jgi:hypothetical protein
MNAEGIKALIRHVIIEDKLKRMLKLNSRYECEWISNAGLECGQTA